MNEPLTAAQLQERLTASPFIGFLGLTVIEADPVRQVVTMTLPMRAEFERISSLVRATLSADRFEPAWAVGQSLPLHEAISRVQVAELGH